VIRVEHFLLAIGVFLLIAGAGLVYDARREEGKRWFRERRRRRRTPRNRTGEALIGGGIMLLGVALIAGEFWRYGTLAVIVGFALVAAGTLLNREYLKELLLFRGAARRTPEGEKPPRRHDDDEPPMRIR
jgi:uncharacterized membrane protein